MSSAGDVNGDGFDDMLVRGLTLPAAPATKLQASAISCSKAGTFPLSNNLSVLTASTAFVSKVSAPYDRSGFSPPQPPVDVNGDGFADHHRCILPQFGNGRFHNGASYVVAWRRLVNLRRLIMADGFWPHGHISLANLDGSQGFVLSGVVTYRRCRVR